MAAHHLRVEHGQLPGDQRGALGLRRAHVPPLAARHSLGTRRAHLARADVLLVYHRRLRRRTLLFLADAAHRVLRRLVPRWTPRRVGLWRFQHNLNEGLEFLFSRKDRMLGPAAWITLDWALTITILWSAFRSVHYPIAPGLVVIGFGVGILFSLVSLVPGGLGV
ncbi:MAG: hypothetical protein E6J68_00090, partial [Deltaproteobacteria bacterium]